MNEKLISQLILTVWLIINFVIELLEEDNNEYINIVFKYFALVSLLVGGGFYNVL